MDALLASTTVGVERHLESDVPEGEEDAGGTNERLRERLRDEPNKAGRRRRTDEPVRVGRRGRRAEAKGKRASGAERKVVDRQLRRRLIAGSSARDVCKRADRVVRQRLAQ